LPSRLIHMYGAPRWVRYAHDQGPDLTVRAFVLPGSHALGVQTVPQRHDALVAERAGAGPADRLRG